MTVVFEADQRASRMSLEYIWHDSHPQHDLQTRQAKCAENLVASFQGKAATLFGVANTSQDARTLLEALEIGTDGVVLRSNEPAEVSWDVTGPVSYTF